MALSFSRQIFECGSARHQISNVRRKQRSHRNGGAGFTLRFKVSRQANITDTSSSSAYVLSSNFSSDYQSVLSERGDEVADDSDGDDNISLNVRQSFGPPSPIQRSGKKGVAVELDDYAVHGVVGRGKFSTVYLATRKVDGVKVALKKIKLGSKPKDRVREKCLREVHLLQTLQHPNIIRYLDSFIAYPNSLGIVIEWATGEISESTCRILLRKISSFLNLSYGSRLSKFVTLSLTCMIAVFCIAI